MLSWLKGDCAKEALERIVMNFDWKKIRINGKNVIELGAKAIRE